MPSEQQVSTHSRPKAAGWWRLISETYLRRFNTQPPEGGWPPVSTTVTGRYSFNTQPPEGGWWHN